MKIRLRLRPARETKSNSFKKTLCAVSLLILSLLNVFTVGRFSSEWSSRIVSFFTQSRMTACPHNVTVDILSVSPTGFAQVMINIVLGYAQRYAFHQRLDLATD